MSETVVGRLDGLLPLHHLTTTLSVTRYRQSLAELGDQLRPFWPRVRRAVIERDDGVRYVHYWQPSEAPGGELQLYLEPTRQGGWVCVNLDRDLTPNHVASADTLPDLVMAVCAALEVGLQSRGVAA